MKRSKSLLFIIPIIGMFGLSACTKANVACGDQIDCTTVTYSATIKPLVATKCAISGCHAGSYGTYTGLKSIADNGNLYSQVIGSENMPTGGINMTCKERAEIECWINAGAPNN